MRDVTHSSHASVQLRPVDSEGEFLAIEIVAGADLDVPSEPWWALTRLIGACLWTPTNALLCGPEWTAYLSQPPAQTNWRQGHDFRECRLGVGGGEFWLTTPPWISWFFAQCPRTLPDDDSLDEAYDSDALLILVNYRGSNDLNDLLDGLADPPTESDVVARLMAVCDFLVFPALHDGEHFRGYMRAEYLYRLIPYLRPQLQG